MHWVGKQRGGDPSRCRNGLGLPFHRRPWRPIMAFKEPVSTMHARGGSPSGCLFGRRRAWEDAGRALVILLNVLGFHAKPMSRTGLASPGTIIPPSDRRPRKDGVAWNRVGASLALRHYYGTSHCGSSLLQDQTHTLSNCPRGCPKNNMDLSRSPTPPSLPRAGRQHRRSMLVASSGSSADDGVQSPAAIRDPSPSACRVSLAPARLLQDP